jgi:hypothetical protein
MRRLLTVALILAAAGCWAQVPATLTANVATTLQTIASITYVPVDVSIESRGVTWQGPATTTTAYIQRCNRIASGTEIWRRRVASTSWDIGLTPELGATSSIVIEIKPAR